MTRSTMRAAVLHASQSGPALTVRTIAVPDVGPRDVLIEVRAVTTSSFDVSAKAHPMVALPHVLGKDPAGVVASIGSEVQSVRTGARVTVGGFVPCRSCRGCATDVDLCGAPHVVGVHRDGGMADYVVVPEEVVVPIPDGVDFAQASIMANTYPQAWDLVVTHGLAAPGRRFLVLAATGGVGGAAVRVALARGADVIAGVGSSAKLAVADAIAGLDGVVDYSVPGWERSVTQRWPQGADVLVDNIADPSLLRTSLGLLAPGGRIVTCGALGPSDVTVNLRSLYLRRQSIIGVNVPGRATVSAVWDAIGSGQLPLPDAYHEVPIEQIDRAHDAIASRTSIGRTVISLTH